MANPVTHHIESPPTRACLSFARAEGLPSSFAGNLAAPARAHGSAGRRTARLGRAIVPGGRPCRFEGTLHLPTLA